MNSISQKQYDTIKELVENTNEFNNKPRRFFTSLREVVKEFEDPECLNETFSGIDQAERLLYGKYNGSFMFQYLMEDSFALLRGIDKEFCDMIQEQVKEEEK